MNIFTSRMYSDKIFKLRQKTKFYPHNANLLYICAMFKLLLLCDYSREPERRLMRGLFEYASQWGGWEYHTLPYFDWKEAPNSLDILETAKALKVDAIFGRWENVNYRLLQKLGIPVIVWGSPDRHPDLPVLCGDYRKIGSMGARFFLQQHYGSYAFLGYDNIYWSRERELGFLEEIKNHSHSFTSLHINRKNQNRQVIKEWLSSLNKPCGLMVAHDELAVSVISICKGIGISIPEDLAIIGVDNDDFLCNITFPKISSIDLDFEKQGYELGRLLWEMYSQKRIWPAQIPLEPIRLVSRGTTVSHTTSDPYILQLIEAMESRYTQPLSLADFLSEIPLCRRSIEKRFHAEMVSTTMLTYLTCLRIEHLCRLLSSTDIPINEAAEKSGFVDIGNLSRVFKKYKGMTPAEYRKQNQSISPVEERVKYHE